MEKISDLGPEKTTGESVVDSLKDPNEDNQSVSKERKQESGDNPEKTSKMSILEPPTFISENKPFEVYKKDLLRWSRLTLLDKKLQAEMIVYKLENHPSRIQEKITTQLGDQLEDNENGIDVLLEFLERIYQKDSMADAWEKYVTFEKFKFDNKISMKQFLADWENQYHKLKNVGCEYSDMILAFKLLDSCKLSAVDEKFVLTGVNYKAGLKKKTLFEQMKESLKKFKGQSVVDREDDDKAVKVSDTYIAKMEEVLLAKGWKPPNSKKRPNPDVASGYRGKKNKLDDNFLPMKCFKCKCECTNNCNCPCRYHFADKCTKKNDEKSKEPKQKEKSDLAHFVKTNLPHITQDLTFFVSDEQGHHEQEDLVMFVNTQAKADEVTLITEDMVCLATAVENEDCVLIDCACPTTVAGEKWIMGFIKNLSPEDKKRVKLEQSERMFKFGGGEKRKSKCLLEFPCNLGGKNIKLRSEVIDAELPLLLGNNSLEKADAVLHIGKKKAEIFGDVLEMKKTNSGHYSLSINNQIGNEVFDYNDIMCLVTESQEELTDEELKRIHHTLGHNSAEKLTKLIINAKRSTDKSGTENRLRKIKSECQGCSKNENRKPKPKVACPRATKFNEVVTLDLKDFKDPENKDNRYILYMIDMFSRMTVGVFIPDKNPETIANKILKHWIGAGFCLMQFIHSDLGGEFINELMTEVAEYLNVRLTTTAASSPNMNGCNERNHATVDRIMSKMMDQDKNMSADIALCWALNAKNSLENYLGFSPFQIVFGESPKLPSVFTAGPPGFEEVVMNKAVADHINALHAAREAFIQCEADRVLKQALKSRIYAEGKDISAGDWIYFKNQRKWEGPVKVTTKNGKLLYAIRKGRLLTINSDHATLAKFEGELLKGSSIEKEIPRAKESVDPSNANTEEDEAPPRQEEMIIQQRSQNGLAVDSNTPDEGTEGEEAINPQVETNVLEEETLGEEEIVAPEQERVEEDNPSLNPTTNTSKVDKSKLREKDKIRFRKSSDLDWKTGVLVKRAGKVRGKYQNYWNIQNPETGHISVENAEEFTDLERELKEKTADVDTNNENLTFAVNLPRWRHREPACVKAKMEELEKFDENDVYEEVEDEGQKRIGTNWVIQEKVVEGTLKTKARLTARGDQEDDTEIRTDSPTVRKGNIKILLAVAAKFGWKIKTSDVTAAFLQGAEAPRDIFVTPPKERRVPGILWKLKTSIYGLCDASRGWYKALSDVLISLGGKRSLLDPALFLFYKDDEENENNLKGMIESHVDDLLHTGDSDFEIDVIKPLKEAFKFGSEGEVEFRYVGMNIKQTKGGIEVDQDHYVEGLEIPKVGFSIDDDEEELNIEGQATFRGIVGKLNHLSSHSRPDLCFETKALSTKFGKAKKKDLKSAVKKLQKLKSQTTKMTFPDLGEVKDWVFIGHGDAGIKSLPDKISSVGGAVVMLANKNTDRVCLLSWKSKKLIRKVVSSLAGEALAMNDTIGEVVYNKAVLRQIFGEEIERVPVIIATDSNNLFKSIYSTSLVEDGRLVPDIAIVKEAIEQGVVTEIRKVDSKEMIANCLTKAGASSNLLTNVVQSGTYKLPGGTEARKLDL